VVENGYAEARTPSLLNRFELVNVEKASDIKNEIWKQLLRVLRKGAVLVKWQGKMYLCEMKADKKGYNRIEIDYHPHMNAFSL
jgi:hypothetical protein